MAAPPPTAILIPRVGDLPSYINPARYERTGRLFLRDAVGHGLEPHHRVLDLGCGAGRFAVALSQFLNRRGSYVGVDVSARSIRICRRYIGRRIHRFHFRRLDAFNSFYNDGSQTPASEVRIPVASGTVDFVFSNSLFTHLCPEDADHYLAEIGRVLRRGGRTLNTMYLLNAESHELLAAPESRQGKTFPYVGSSLVKHPDDPARWIAHDQASVFAAHEGAGMELESVHYGRWCGRTSHGKAFGDKDHVVAVRSDRHSPGVAAAAVLRRSIGRV